MPSTCTGTRPAVLEVAGDVAWHLWPQGLDPSWPRPVFQSDPAAALSPGQDHWEITWNTPAAGRHALPLRLTRREALRALALCRGGPQRPVPWCLIDTARVELIRLVGRLTADWGQGISSLARGRRGDGDHGLTPEEATLIQRASRIRVWLGGPRRLDPFRIRAALLHGCLPLQLVPEADHAGLLADLPPGLHGFTLAIPGEGPLPGLSAKAVEDRLTAGLSVVLAGSLERDLAMRGLSPREVA